MPPSPTPEQELAFLDCQIIALRDSGPPHLTRDRALRLGELRARRAALLARLESAQRKAQAG